MRRGASAPQELETPLEDGFALRDGTAVAELLEEGATGRAPHPSAALRRQPDFERIAAIVTVNGCEPCA